VKPRPETKEELISMITTYMATGDSLNNIDVSAITDMSHLFEGSGWNGDISSWDVSHVTNMERMFRNSKFNGDISKWDVSNVENMEGLFSSSEFNGDISKWNVSKVTNMRSLFYGTKFTGDISGWDVSNVTNMRTVFYKSKFNGDISRWNVSKVQTMESMFMYSEFNSDISGWDVSNVENIKDVFKGSKFKGNIFNWHVDKVQDVSSLWEGGWSPEDSQMLKNHFCRETTEPNKSEKQSAAQEPSQNSANGNKVDPDFDPFGGAFGEMFSNIFGQKTASQPTEMESPKFISGVFTDKKALKEAIIHNISAFGSNIDLNSMDVSQVTDMSDLFSSWPAAGFNGDISKWDVSHVTNMDCMFQHSEFNGDISQWDVSHVTSMKCMFQYSKFNGDISSWDVSHVTNMQWLFYDSAFHGDIFKWNIAPNCKTDWMLDNSKFSADEKFNIFPPSTFTDPRDGQRYRVVKIGNQVWMAENLRYKCKSGCYAYDDDESNVGRNLGRLYEWDVAQEACPPGWHLPSMDEWHEFCSGVGLDSVDEKERENNFRKIIVKPWAENLNIIPHFDETLPPSRYRDLEEKRVNQQLQEINSLKFSLVPSGERGYKAFSNEPYYSGLGSTAYFWCGTKIHYEGEDGDRRVYYDFEYRHRLYRSGYSEKIGYEMWYVPELEPYPKAFSIRCIKD
ncbi:MAG: BspA family leucine-rich repeat surface protein, partial [Aeriscardovia sp.]|nr:BspA family leucine-rich repeat surface protein [Aeriscardovia sp.]